MKLKLMDLNLRWGQLPNLVALRLGIVALKRTVTMLTSMRNQDMMNINLVLLDEFALMSLMAELSPWSLV